MKTDIIPLVIGLLIFISSILSLHLNLSVAIIEIFLGTIVGYFGLKPTDWMLFLASFGGIILTYLAGAEIDTRLMKEKFKESFLIGFFSFLLPFLATIFYTYYFLNWKLKAALIAGCALSTTSLAVVYSVLVETGLTSTNLGKTIMAATFITDIGTALALSILFLKPDLFTFIFLVISIIVIIIVDKYTLYIFRNPKYANKVIEPEVKYIFFILLIFMFFAELGKSHAILPAFILGLVMSKHYKEHRKTRVVKYRLRTVAYAIITPLFFIVGGMKISIPLILSSFKLFLILFILKIFSKFIGVYFLAKKYLPDGSMYTTLLMSTGLTFGTISSLFGLKAGYIDQIQYSLLVGVVIASAIIPTFIAQKLYLPIEIEDLVEEENGNKE